MVIRVQHNARYYTLICQVHSNTVTNTIRLCRNILLIRLNFVFYFDFQINLRYTLKFLQCVHYK